MSSCDYTLNNSNFILFNKGKNDVIYSPKYFLSIFGSYNYFKIFISPSYFLKIKILKCFTTIWTF